MWSSHSCAKVMWGCWFQHPPEQRSAAALLPTWAGTQPSHVGAQSWEGAQPQVYTGRRSLKDLPRQKANSPTDGGIFHVCGGKSRCWGRTQRHGPSPEKGPGEAALATPSPQRFAFWQTASHPSPPSPPPPATRKLEPSRRVWVHTGVRKFNTGRRGLPGRWRGTSAYLSKVAARMYLPFGENFTKDTGGLSSSVGKQTG